MTTYNETHVNEAVNMVEDGSTKGKVESMLMFKYDYSTNQSKDIAKLAFEKCGISSNAYGQADHKETVSYLRQNYGKIAKKDLINGMCKVNGKTYKTNQHAYNYIAMMIEWANQEVASK